MQPATTPITPHLFGKVVQKTACTVVYITFSGGLPMTEVNNQYGGHSHSIPSALWRRGLKSPFTDARVKLIGSMWPVLIFTPLYIGVHRLSAHLVLSPRRPWSVASVSRPICPERKDKCTLVTVLPSWPFATWGHLRVVGTEYQDRNKTMP